MGSEWALGVPVAPKLYIKLFSREERLGPGFPEGHSTGLLVHQAGSTLVALTQPDGDSAYTGSAHRNLGLGLVDFFHCPSRWFSLFYASLEGGRVGSKG